MTTTGPVLHVALIALCMLCACGERDAETLDATPRNVELHHADGRPAPLLRSAWLKHPPSAFALIDSLEQSAAATHGDMARAGAELQRALAYAELGLPGSSLDRFGSAADLLARAGHLMPLPARLAQVDVAIHGGRRAMAGELIEGLLHDAEADHDTALLAAALNLRGILRIHSAMGEEGVADLDSVMAMAHAGRFHDTLMVLLLQGQSKGYHHLSQWDSAMYRTVAAMDINQRLGDRIGECRNELDIALIHVKIGDYTAAMEHTTRSHHLAEQEGSEWDMLLADHLLAWESWGIIDPDEVWTRWASALRRAEVPGFDLARARILEKYPLFMMNQDSALQARFGLPHAMRYDSAMTMLKPMHILAEAEGLDGLYWQYRRSECAVINYSGDKKGALGIAQRLLDHARTAGDVSRVADAFVLVSANHYGLGEWDRARIAADSALRIATMYGLNATAESALSRLSHSYNQLGRGSEAFATRLRRDVLLDELTGETVARNIGHLTADRLAARKQAADSIVHVQRIALKEATIAQQRSRTWLVGAVALLLIAGGAAAYALDRRRRRERFQREALQLEMQALRAQMNPHFLFNALASINGFIARQEPEQAREFVARFARLTRLVLENSRHAEVPLSRDLEALRLYLDLEQARTGNGFSYTIEVDPALDQEAVHVPPLLIQPFAENAVWHGFAGKQTKGVLTVRVEPADGAIRITVQDNGVGIAVAAPGAEDHTSLGSTITRTRLRLVQDMKGRAADLRYVPVEHGTRVEMLLPT